MTDKQKRYGESGGFRTLELKFLQGKTKETIGPFQSGKVEILNQDPAYVPPRFDAKIVFGNPNAAYQMVDTWITHVGKYLYFLQFHDDITRVLTTALHDHTELISDLCDSRLKIDPADLWGVFDSVPG